MLVNLVLRRRTSGGKSSSADFTIAGKNLRSYADRSPRDRSSATRSKAGYAINMLLAVLVALSSVLPRAATAQEPILDAEAYHRAVDFCRQQSWPVFTLDPDKHILCFDATIPANLDISEAKQLRENGLFVVRSLGGDSPSAIALAQFIRDRHATVVVYDYCLSACASFLLISSHLAYVVKGALVAWHNFAGENLCTHLVPQASGPKKLERGPCEPRLAIVPSDDYWPQVSSCLSERTVDPSYRNPPDSLYVRRIVTNTYTDTGVYRDVMWTLHPRHYPMLFKTKIYYEAYPENQEEVDEMARRVPISPKVIYDPLP